MSRSIQAFCVFALLLVLATAAFARSNKGRPSKGNMIQMKSNGRGVVRRNAEFESQSSMCSSTGRVCAELIDNTSAQFTNNMYIQASVQVTFNVHKNLVVTTSDDGKKLVGKVLRFILPARPAGGDPTVTTVFTLKSLKESKGFEVGFGIEERAGSNKAKLSSDATFRLPFAGSFKVGQGYNGKASHTGKDAFSIDFTMAEGTRILAARDGVVFKTESSNWLSKYDDGICAKPVSRKCNAVGSEDNNINVAHSDGTYAQYVHLKLEGVAVSVGDSVSAGQLLGYSGNTGYSKGPHLHISINKATTWEKRDHSESIKVTYLDSNGNKVTPATGKTYEGAPEA